VLACGETGRRRWLLGGAHRQGHRHVLRRAWGGTASGLYSRAAPSLHLEVKTLHLPHSTTAILDLRAQGTGEGPRGTRGGRVQRGIG
jgi:hypothetical protein